MISAVRFPALRFGLAAMLAAACAPVALADKIKNPTAVFSGLDKITGRIISFEVSIDETVQFGSLQLTPKVCYSRPDYENPRTTTFVEVDEVNAGNEFKRVFTGWMFASSPGLSAIEHPVYDIWLTECKGGTEIIKTPAEEEEDLTPPPATEARRPPPKTPERTTRVARPGSSADPSLPDAPQQGRPEPRQRFFPTNGNVPARGGPLQIGPDLFRSN